MSDKHAALQDHVKAARAIHIAFVLCCGAILLVGSPPEKAPNEESSADEAESTVSLLGVTLDARSFWQNGGGVALSLIVVLCAHLLSIKKRIKRWSAGEDKIQCLPWLALDGGALSWVVALVFTVVLPIWAACKAYSLTASWKDRVLTVRFDEPSFLLQLLAGLLGGY